MYSDIIGSIETMASEILTFEKGVGRLLLKWMALSRRQGLQGIRLRQLWPPEFIFNKKVRLRCA
jgi:hypothetical protein